MFVVEGRKHGSKLKNGAGCCQIGAWATRSSAAGGRNLRARVRMIRSAIVAGNTWTHVMSKMRQGRGGWYQWHSGSLTGPVRRGTMEEEEEEEEGERR